MNENTPHFGAEEARIEKSIRVAKHLAKISLLCGLIGLIIASLPLLYDDYAYHAKYNGYINLPRTDSYLVADISQDLLTRYSCWADTLLGISAIILGASADAMTKINRENPSIRKTFFIAIVGILLGIITLFIAFINYAWFIVG